LIINCRDITERRKLETQLAQANRLAGLGRLAATVSHEFNNVLMGIQPFVDLIRRTALDRTSQHATLQITNSIRRGKRISEEILTFTRAVEPARRRVHVRTWLGELETELRALVGTNVRLAILAPEALALDADVGQLSQVLTNLAINARDAGATSIRIEASSVTGDGVFPFGVVRDPARFVHLRVADNGGGIPEAVIANVFEPLFTTKNGSGTGLGLAVAHKIVAGHGGEIFVESTPGRGTVFHVFLPASLSVAPEPGSDNGLQAHPVASCRVLLVEDDPAVAEGISSLLECEGYDVTVAMTGAEALRLVPRIQPDVTILDIGLPDIDGIEVYTRIRAQWPGVGVIFSTGQGDATALEERLPDHPRALLKPYSVEELIEAINHLVASRDVA
jgi:nitrogen-specific signal transduction histidine kinase/CheY-like chemotaxis protein